MKCNNCKIVEMRVIKNDGKNVELKCPNCQETKKIELENIKD